MSLPQGGSPGEHEVPAPRVWASEERVRTCSSGDRAGMQRASRRPIRVLGCGRAEIRRRADPAQTHSLSAPHGTRCRRCPRRSRGRGCVSVAGRRSAVDVGARRGGWGVLGCEGAQSAGAQGLGQTGPGERVPAAPPPPAAGGCFLRPRSLGPRPSGAAVLRCWGVAESLGPGRAPRPHSVRPSHTASGGRTRSEPGRLVRSQGLPRPPLLTGPWAALHP